MVHTHTGTKWRAMPTCLDRLFYPSLEFGGGGAEGNVSLLAIGNDRETKAQGAYAVLFHGVDLIAGYSETIYWSLAEEKTRPQGIVSEIVNSNIIEEFMRFRSLESKKHFLVCGGDMCCELVACDEFKIREYPSVAVARSALAAEMMR